jgi:hypothetical protein
MFFSDYPAAQQYNKTKKMSRLKSAKKIFYKEKGLRPNIRGSAKLPAPLKKAEPGHVESEKTANSSASSAAPGVNPAAPLKMDFDDT